MIMNRKKYDKTKCWECGGKRIELTDRDSNGVVYKYWKCMKCGDAVLDMDQLHEAAEQYKKIIKVKHVKISKWGTALAVRIPKEIVTAQNIKSGEKVRIQEEKIGFRVIPEK
jgi:hypothetical protein